MITADNNEKLPIFHEKLDDTRLLKVDDERGWSYDFHVTCHDGTEYKFERKSFKDLRDSWMQDRLSRQCSYVDGLIVEYNDFDVDYDDQLDVNVLNHLVVMGANMWVIHTTSPEDTIRKLRFIERRGKMDIKDNGIKMKAANPQWMLLQAMPQVNPWRELTGGRYFGDEVCKVIDWEKVVDGFRFDEWRSEVAWGKSRAMPKKTIEKLKARLLSGD